MDTLAATAGSWSALGRCVGTHSMGAWLCRNERRRRTHEMRVYLLVLVAACMLASSAAMANPVIDNVTGATDWNVSLVVTPFTIGTDTNWWKWTYSVTPGRIEPTEHLYAQWRRAGHVRSGGRPRLRQRHHRPISADAQDQRNTAWREWVLDHGSCRHIHLMGGW